MVVTTNLAAALTRFPDPPKPLYTIECGSAAAIKRALIDSLVHSIGKDPATASTSDWFNALAFVVRGIVNEQYIQSARKHEVARKVHYLANVLDLRESSVKRAHMHWQRDL